MYLQIDLYPLLWVWIPLGSFQFFELLPKLSKFELAATAFLHLSSVICVCCHLKGFVFIWALSELYFAECSQIFPFSGDYLKLEGIKRIAEGRWRCFGMFDVKGDSSKIRILERTGSDIRAIMISSSFSCIGIVEIKLRARAGSQLIFEN